MEIRIRLPREDLMALAKLASSRNQATSVTASEIVRNHIAAEQSVHLTAFGASARAHIAHWLISLAYRILPNGGR